MAFVVVANVVVVVSDRLTYLVFFCRLFFIIFLYSLFFDLYFLYPCFLYLFLVLH